ncbi:MAG: HIT family protein [Myxococcales bacterium]|nr:HIT family protein [Myxococcales bacterium]
MSTCPFCAPEPTRVFHEDALVRALWDAFPVAPGHALIVPRRHVADWFDATDDERVALTRTLDVARAAVQARHPADGFTIGINAGVAAGQTVPHLHVHLIPRVVGDVADPRGGVRWVVPARADYWSARRER